MMIEHALSRSSDAAFFEYWSEWSNLDGLPERPLICTAYGSARAIDRVGAYSRCYCIPDPSNTCFAICVSGYTASEIVRRIPGTRHDRRTRELSRLNCYVVPARSWRALRAALPSIKAACSARAACAR